MRGSLNLGYSYQCYGFGNISASDSMIVTGIGAKVTDRESCEVPTLMLRIHCRLRVSSAIASSSKLPLVLHGISGNSLYPYIEGTRAAARLPQADIQFLSFRNFVDGNYGIRFQFPCGA